MADGLGIIEISGDESPEVDGFADLHEDVAIGQLARPLGPVDLTLQLENYFSIRVFLASFRPEPACQSRSRRS